MIRFYKSLTQQEKDGLGCFLVIVAVVVASAITAYNLFPSVTLSR